MTTVLFFKTLAILFTVINPYLYLPVFLELTKDKDASGRRRAALQTIGWCLLLALVVIVVGPGALSGSVILIPLGIELADATIAGGIILLIAALLMLLGKPLALQEGSEQERAQYTALKRIAFYPMAFPLIMGPVTMVSLCLMSLQVGAGTEAEYEGNVIAFLVAVAIALVILGVTLCFATTIGARMSIAKRAIATRLSGMLLLGFAVETLRPLL